LRAAEERIRKLEADIVKEYERLEEINGGSHTRRLAEMDQRKTELEEARKQLEEHALGKRELEINKARAVKAVEEAKGPRSAKFQEIQETKEHLQNLFKNRDQQRTGYPPRMPQLINAIRKDDSFRERPLGPIGDHVRLKKPVWSSILEKSLGAILNGFIVTSKQDQARLSYIMQKVQWYVPYVRYTPLEGGLFFH
jgi:structural maintenance of chromosomes protein 6